LFISVAILFSPCVTSIHAQDVSENREDTAKDQRNDKILQEVGNLLAYLYSHDSNEMSIQDMEFLIEEAGKYLKIMHWSLTDPQMPASERIAVSDMYVKIEDERDVMLLRLECAKNGEPCIVPTDTFGQNMPIEEMQIYVKKNEVRLYDMQKKT
jgi:hypothetical protein